MIVNTAESTVLSTEYSASLYEYDESLQIANTAKKKRRKRVVGDQSHPRSKRATHRVVFVFLAVRTSSTMTMHDTVGLLVVHARMTMMIPTQIRQV